MAGAPAQNAWAERRSKATLAGRAPVGCSEMPPSQSTISTRSTTAAARDTALQDAQWRSAAKDSRCARRSPAGGDTAIRNGAAAGQGASAWRDPPCATVYTRGAVAATHSAVPDNGSANRFVPAPGAKTSDGGSRAASASAGRSQTDPGSRSASGSDSAATRCQTSSIALAALTGPPGSAVLSSPGTPIGVSVLNEDESYLAGGRGKNTSGLAK